MCRDCGFNGTVQDYPFFMLISFLFKEKGPENSVVLYNDPCAISNQGQTLPFVCTGKTDGKWTQLQCIRSIGISGPVISECLGPQLKSTLGTRSWPLVLWPCLDGAARHALTCDEKLHVYFKRAPEANQGLQGAFAVAPFNFQGSPARGPFLAVSAFLLLSAQRGGEGFLCFCEWVCATL